MKMDIHWVSFFLGGVVFLLGFLAIMAWIVPDEAAGRAMTWLVAKRNFSKIGLIIGIIGLSMFVTMIVIAIIELLHYVQMASWVWAALWIGLGFFLISLVVLLITRRRQSAP